MVKISEDGKRKLVSFIDAWYGLCSDDVKGNNFVCWMGTQPKLVVTEPDLIKETPSNKEGIFSKIKLKGYLKKLLGDGIVMEEGEKWLKLRKLANHSFHGDCLKDMVPAMIARMETMLEKWRYHEGKEIDVCDGFKILTSKVISRTAFGSSYLEGREIFALLTKLHTLISRKTLNIKFFGMGYVFRHYMVLKFIRTKNEIEADKIEKYESMTNLLAIICVSFVFSFSLIIFVYKLWWAPLHLQHRMEFQGIRGPSYKLFHGSTKEMTEMKNQISNTPMDLSHDIFPRIQPHFYSWIKLYGNNVLSWMGTQPNLVVTEPDLIKEILNNKEGIFPKIKLKGLVKKIFGDGIVVAEGEKWLKLRKLANHSFHGDCLKDMVPAMIASVETMLEKWRYHEGKEIDVCDGFKILTSEVISRTAFGSSYLEGREIFALLTKLHALISRKTFNIKFFGIGKFIRTKDVIEADNIEKLLNESIMEIVKKRRDEVIKGRASSFGSDFLGSLLKAHHDMDRANQISPSDILDECKTFYFAGHETTYSLLSWSVLLLALHSDWQEKARNEVLQLFGQENPKSEGIARLKIVNMIIYETLRLYSPIINITRRIERKVKLGKYEFPANVDLNILPLAIHRNPDIWGKDAHLFKPERFSEGLAKATNGNAMAFLGFGFGPRICLICLFFIEIGKIHYFWNGDKAELVVTEPGLVKEVLNNSVSYSKTEVDKYMRKIIGDGIVACEGAKWVKLRKLANQAFHAENLKNMIPAMVESVETMLKKWKTLEKTEVDVIEEFVLLTSEVISRTAFGSSYSQGEKVFQMLRKLAFIISRNAYKIRVSGISHLFKNNDDIESEKMEKEIQYFFLQILDQRERIAIREEQNFGSDFLGSLLKAKYDSVERNRISKEEIIDECKTFYGAGYGTTSILLSWTVLLLAIHSEWQEKAREEVVKVFGRGNPNSDGLSRLKTMNMIINESLRLYPPLPVNERRSTEGARLGNLILPPNTKINVPIVALHHDPTIWGEDAHLFKPERFSKGIAAATNNNLAAFSPFGLGPRICVGLNFAINEAKIALSMILQRYKFTLSPNYVHSPVHIITLRPQHGIQVILHAI
ncbi:hypothetical protein BUALT_Bualt05G0139400 [Buddleja alternifolia]|uniref:Cytochrome P450 n=1 Tax=Buddleja alternifolia TaxID=168488 RepID=A0AAV6XVI9_9LAMI|nr:hypothetical protein BUALT_Bualt05G0139400 [Buddleja alternifolia]